jgi:hypothetical protein
MTMPFLEGRGSYEMLLLLLPFLLFPSFWRVGAVVAALSPTNEILQKNPNFISSFSFFFFFFSMCIQRLPNMPVIKFLRVKSTQSCF